MPHETSIRVRGYHVDMFGHVNNARYLEFMEEGRWQFAEDTGLKALLDACNQSIVIARIDIQFRRPALLEEDLTLKTSIGELGPRRCIMRQDLLKAGGTRTVSEAEVTAVLVSLKDGKAARIEGPVHELLVSLAEESGCGAGIGGGDPA